MPPGWLEQRTALRPLGSPRKPRYTPVPPRLHPASLPGQSPQPYSSVGSWKQKKEKALRQVFVALSGETVSQLPSEESKHSW